MSDRHPEAPSRQTAERAPELPVLRPKSRKTPPSDAPVPSDQGFLRQLGRVWIRRAMLLCAVLAITTAAAVPLLALLRVKEVAIVGAVYYDTADLLEITGISMGDELLITDPEEIETRMLAGMPYLSSVQVERGLNGRVIITVSERTPYVALDIGKEKVALLDEQMKVLEIVPAGEQDAALCRVTFTLFADGSAKDLIPGDTYGGNPTAIEKVKALLAACRTICPDTAPVLVDMSDPYSTTLALTDGTIVAMHECKDPERQLRVAMEAVRTYRDFHGYPEGALRVDVDDFFRVSLRPIG